MHLDQCHHIGEHWQTNIIRLKNYVESLIQLHSIHKLIINRMPILILKSIKMVEEEQILLRPF